MKRIFYPGVLLFLLIMASCSEVYYPEDVDSTKRIPVIQGIITEGQSPKITLSWARNYASDTFTYISGAGVIVTDDKGTSATLAEVSPGVYMPSYTEIKGVAGNTYTLYVFLPNGNRYESAPQYLKPAPQIDSMYAKSGITEVYSYNSSGEPIVSEQQGINISADLSENVQQGLYYRFKTKVVKLMVYTEDIGSPASHSVFLWETRMVDNSYSVDYSVRSQGRQVLYQHPIGFLRYFYDATLETETKTAPFTEAWVLTLNVYSVSKDVYEYYNSISRQLDADNEIFAPVASQVKSNITCISDPAEKVAGVFEASSVNTIYRAFRWKDTESVYSKDLDSYPDNLGDGYQMFFPPDFWVNF
jgi:hypothetical protein